MLQLHDRAKADAEFQRTSPQARVDFAPGTTWVCYSDQVLHAAMGGQHMFEQTFQLDAAAPRRSGERAARDPRAARRATAAVLMIDDARAGDAAVRRRRVAGRRCAPCARSRRGCIAFRPRLLDDLAGYDTRRFGADLGAGITVGIVALPLAMAFAIASGVKPEQGIFTAIIAGFLISALGGSSVQIGGPAGAFIVIVYGIVQRYGVANLLIATVLAGVLLLALGWLRLGALVRLIPVSIVIGFTNGIAVLIAVSQIKDLLGLRIENVPADFFAQAHAIAVHVARGQPGRARPRRDLLRRPSALGPAGRVLDAVAQLRASASRSAPCCRRSARAGWCGSRRESPARSSSLVTLSIAAALLALPVETIGTRFGGIPRALPAFVWPDFDWATRAAPVRADGDDRPARRRRVAALRARRRRHDDDASAPRPEPGADGAGHRQHRHAVLRRHPGDRHDRAHRHQPARRRDQPGRRHRPCGRRCSRSSSSPRRWRRTCRSPSSPACCSSSPGTWASGTRSGA